MLTVNIYDNYYSTNVLLCSGFTTEEGTNLTQQAANTLVETLYNDSKNLGAYIDKIVNLSEGYAELKINLPDGRVLNRVIYTEEI